MLLGCGIVENGINVGRFDCVFSPSEPLFSDVDEGRDRLVVIRVVLNTLVKLDEESDK